jgi:phosphomannomutase
MHGVGYPFVQQAFEAFHLPPPVPVTLQVEPDPDFPTVVYPNPEEGRSALDLAMETADRHGHVIIIANDPDADRLALAEKQPGNGVKDSYWRVFTGNEIGAILGWWALDNYKMKKKDQFDGSKVHMISTAVSSKILKSMADIEGFQFQETLTGFKWMGNISHDLIERGEEVLFAFEEAIGFMFGSMVLDKDGVSSAAVVGEMAGYLYRNGRSFASLLDDVYTKYGRVLSHNSYFICNSKDTISELFENLRKNKKVL